MYGIVCISKMSSSYSGEIYLTIWCCVTVISMQDLEKYASLNAVREWKKLLVSVNEFFWWGICFSKCFYPCFLFSPCKFYLVQLKHLFSPYSALIWAVCHPSMAHKNIRVCEVSERQHMFSYLKHMIKLFRIFKDGSYVWCSLLILGMAE